MQTSYNDYFQSIEMSAFYFNLFPHFHKRFVLYLRILRQVFWPKKDIVFKLSDITRKASVVKKIMARIKAPYFVFALIAEEIGWGISFMLLIKLYIDMLLSVFNYFRKTETYFDYIKKMGVNPDDIKRAVKQIQ